MNASQKITQYLSEARASEDALVRVLQSQIAMTPSGSYRSGLEDHLDETRRHSERVGRRLSQLDASSNLLLAAVGAWEGAVGQALALGKLPLDLLRGTGGEEKVLKNAKDAAATEALEIATYTAIETLARSVDDDTTAELAASIRADEERMLARILREIPALTDAVARAELHDDPSYDVTRTGAADAVRAAGRTATGVAADEADLGIARYDSLTADEITSRLPGLSQDDLARVDSYERAHQDRSTVIDRVSALRAEEPWPGYDELTAPDVRSTLSELDRDRVEQVRAYERSHKNRAGVLKAAERERTGS